MQGVNHGRPVYKRQGVSGIPDVLVFFWDDRDGHCWSGWWLGPEIGWDHPGWARHENGASRMPPASGWMLPSVGQVDDTLLLSFGPGEGLQEVTPCSVGCPPQLLHLSGCQSPVVASIIMGCYSMQGINHERPVYRKHGISGTPDVVIFFWDERDGTRWCGWWLGPKIGWDHPGWARHQDRTARTPPMAGWQVPAYGPMDETMRLSYVEQRGVQDGSSFLASGS